MSMSTRRQPRPATVPTPMTPQTSVSQTPASLASSEPPASSLVETPAPQMSAPEAALPPPALEGASGSAPLAALKKELNGLVTTAPELAPYRDEPPQMPSGAVGKYGYTRLAFRREGAQSVLYDIDRRAPALVQKALYWDEALPHMPCVFLISTSGCLLQGDRIVMDFVVEDNACAHITTQCATKVHSMEANCAAQLQKITVHDGGYLEYMPDPIIPHRHARYFGVTHIRCAARGVLLYGETVLCGRRWHHEDERYGFDLMCTDVRSLRLENDTELFAEKNVLAPTSPAARQDICGAGCMNGYDVFATVYFLAPEDLARDVLAQTEPEGGQGTPVLSGASLLPHNCGLVFRVAGQNSESVKASVREFWARARRSVTGAELPREFLWR